MRFRNTVFISLIALFVERAALITLQLKPLKHDRRFWEMKLLTKEIRKALPPIGATDDQTDPVAIVKFFNPTGIGTWWACEFDPDSGIFFGKADLGFPELGSFSLDELQSYKGPLGLGIERDIHFTPKPLSQCK
jgi:hypothetical protein